LCSVFQSASRMSSTLFQSIATGKPFALSNRSPRQTDSSIPAKSIACSSRFSGPLRVVDVGCGIGYNIRWLAAHTTLPSERVELTGVDLNSGLIHEANR